MYEGQRREITELIIVNNSKILDIGCACGDVGEAIKEKGNCEVVGIEYDPEQAKIASGKIDKVIVGDVEKINPGFEKEYFDYIIFADVLEHLREPADVLEKYKKYLNDNGYIVLSLPNVRHLSVLKELLIQGDWEYKSFGILDKTHLRFFTKKSILRLLKGTGLCQIKMNRIFSLKGSRAFNKITFGLFSDMLTAQYVFLVKKVK